MDIGEHELLTRNFEVQNQTPGSGVVRQEQDMLANRAALVYCQIS